MSDVCVCVVCVVCVCSLVPRLLPLRAPTFFTARRGGSLGTRLACVCVCVCVCGIPKSPR